MAQQQPSKPDRFIDALLAGSGVKASLDAAGWSMADAMRQQRKDPDFAARWSEAVEHGQLAKQYRLFLEVIRKTGNVAEGLRLSGLTRAEVMALRKIDPDFESVWAEAKEDAADALEAEAWRRAVEGVRKPIIRDGGFVFMRTPDGDFERDELGAPVPAYELVFSDRLLELLLKANRPEKFKENVNVDHTVRGGVLLAPARVPKEVWEHEVGKRQLPFRGNKA